MQIIFLNNVKAEKNKIQFFSIALSNDAWIENLFSAAYLFQQCVIDLTYVIQPFEPVYRFSGFFIEILWRLYCYCYNYYSRQLSHCSLCYWSHRLPVWGFWLKWQHTIAYVEIYTNTQIVKTLEFVVCETPDLEMIVACDIDRS